MGSGITYDMWRNDITRTNPSQPSGSFDIYSANYYVMNSDFRVYICLYNNALLKTTSKVGLLWMNPHSLTLNPNNAGNSGDGYIWKYLYTIKPSQAIKFDSTSYIPTPNNWETNTDVETLDKTQHLRDN